MIMVTGMHRSGTSCIAGLLSLCGFSLGTSHALLNESRFDNEKGHFENLGAVTINERILRDAGGSWDNPPLPNEIAKVGEKFNSEIRQFFDTFNGDIVKDPRSCLTISLWEDLSAGCLEAIILCLRHPRSVALSLHRRNGIPIDGGLGLWTRYNASIMENVSKIPLIVVDYDNLKSNLPFEMGCLMERLGRRLPAEELIRLTEGFYSEELDHAPLEQHPDIHLPDQVNALYQTMRARTFSACHRDGVFGSGHQGPSYGDLPLRKRLPLAMASSKKRIADAIAYLRSLKIFHS